MKRAILQAPDPRLREIAKEVDFSDYSTVEVHLPVAIADLRDTFEATVGAIGLAAPQIGIGLRVILVDITKSRSQSRLMINPVVTKASPDLQMVRDGCLSIAHGRRFDYTRRAKRIELEWKDEHGAKHWQKFNGTMAACILHEIDHLDGILFTDLLPGSRTGNP